MSGSELPNGWIREPIGLVCRLINGRAFRPTDWTETGRPIVRIQNLNNTNAPFNRYSGPVKPQFLIDNDELLFAWSGTPGTSFGAHIWKRGPAILNQHIFRVLFDPTRLDRRFLQLSINERLGELIHQAHGGAGLAHVTKPIFEATEILVPPLAEQRRIVARLDDLLSRSRRAREALADVPSTLDQLRQSVLAAAFRGDLTAAWREAHPDVEPASALLERIRAERRRRFEAANPEKKYVPPPQGDAEAEGLPELPVGWCWTTLAELIDGIDAGKSPRAEGRPAANGEYGVLKVSAVTWREFNPYENKAMLQGQVPEPGMTVRAGDLLISRANTWQLVGAVVLVERDHPNLMLCDKTLRLRYLPDLDPEYLLYALRTREVRRVYEGDATGTSDSMRNLSQAKIGSAPIALAPLSEQRAISAVIREQWSRAADVKRLYDGYTADLDLFERTILAKAFRGELVEPDVDDDLDANTPIRPPGDGAALER